MPSVTWPRRHLVDAGVVFVGPVLDEYPTGTCVVLVAADGERTMLPDRGANDRLPMSAVIGGLDPMPGWVHLSGYAILHEGSRNAGRAALSAGIAGGATVVIDAASTAPIKAVGRRGIPQLDRWRHPRLRQRRRGRRRWAASRPCSSTSGAVVVKHGAAGATCTDGRTTVTAEGFPVDAVDSTGAGDAFAAGWIASVRGGAEPEGGAGRRHPLRSHGGHPGRCPTAAALRMTSPLPDAVVFDFDGTIFDSETPIYRASAAALAEMGLTLTIPGWATVVGHGEDDSYRAMCAAVGADFDRAEFDERYDRQDRSWRDTLPALPGSRRAARRAGGGSGAVRSGVELARALGRHPPGPARPA